MIAKPKRKNFNEKKNPTQNETNTLKPFNPGAYQVVEGGVHTYKNSA